MARRTRLGSALDDAEETAGTDNTEGTQDDNTRSATPAKSASKTNNRKPAKKTNPRKKSQGSQSTSRTRKQPTKAAAKPAKKSEPANPEPEVLGIDTRSAKRQTIYLHPDDHRALAQARIDDDADANARVRAMIAVWRTNSRYRALVDRLARTAPRGGGH